MTIIDGKRIAQNIRKEIAYRRDNYVRQGYRPPCLGIVLVGNDPASVTYVNNKRKACDEVGIHVQLFHYDETITKEQLLNNVHSLNNNPSIDGFIVQLPLPAHINELTVSSQIAYNKDVDGLSPENIGRTMQGLPAIASATPQGILLLLRHYHIPTAGKNITIIGRSNIVGKPLAGLLMQKSEHGNATVTICHTYTKNLKQICLLSNIIIVAAGQPHLLTADMVSEGTVVIDVGITRIQDNSSDKGYKLAGDVDFEHVAPKCSYITPVPGGVGPMTIASLLLNVMTIYTANIKSYKL